jgi:AcrR family transcriptional regulator
MVISKTEIIKIAFDQFSHYGIKRVSMDDIARTAGISKRTLYEFFDDKETLLVEGIKNTGSHLYKYLQELEKTSCTAIDVFILFYEELMRQPRWYHHKFYEDLKKYPKALIYKEEEKAVFTQKCIDLFNRGIKEGVLREEVNFEIVALLAKDQIKMIHPSKAFSKHSNAEVYNTVLVTFLRGICTEKGVRIVEKWIATKKIHNIS